MAPVASVAETIKAYTAVLPPYTLGADLPKPGISHELLVEMGRRADISVEIVYLPWKRAQAMAQRTENTLLFTATRSPEREALYGWITLMIEPREVFVTTREPISDYASAATLPAVAVLDGTPRQRRLADHGLDNVETVRDAASAARMLHAGRVASWYTFDQRAAAVYKAEGFDPSELVFGSALQAPQNWLASNLQFDPTLAAALAAALDDMRADGAYDRIVAKYIE